MDGRTRAGHGQLYKDVNKQSPGASTLALLSQPVWPHPGQATIQQSLGASTLALLSGHNYIAPMRAQQKTLFDYFDMKDTKRRYGRTQHGGLKSKGRRKEERPLSTNKWIHLVLKSDKAKGPLSLLANRNQTFVDKTLKTKANQFGVKIAELVNVGTHVHVKLKIKSRLNFQRFLKSVTTLIARHVTGARKGKPFGRFWQGLAFTRVLKTTLEELNLRGYLEANRLEASKCYEAREAYLKQFNRWVYRERRICGP